MTSRPGSPRRPRPSAGTWQTARVTHASLETHGARGWLDEDGRLVIRASTQVPFLVRDELAHILGLPRGPGPGASRPGWAAASAASRRCSSRTSSRSPCCDCGSPVQLELTREQQFTLVPSRHPMRVSVTAGADADGVLTALVVDVLSDTGAYGNHAVGVLFHGCHESVALYRCANKRVDGEAVYTNHVPSGAFRGYGLGPGDLRDRVGPRRARPRARHLPGRAAPAQRRPSPVTSSSSTASRTPTWSSAATASTSASTWSRRRSPASDDDPGTGRRALGGRRGHGRLDDRHHPAARPPQRGDGQPRRRRHRDDRRRQRGVRQRHRRPCTSSWSPRSSASTRPGSGCTPPTPTRRRTTPAPTAPPGPWSPAHAVAAAARELRAALDAGEAPPLEPDRRATTARRARSPSTCTASGSRSTGRPASCGS